LPAGAHGDRLVHLVERDGSSVALDEAAERRGRQLRKQHDAAVRMDEEFDPVAGLQPKVIANRLGNGRLALGRDHGFHGAIEHYKDSIAIL